MNNNSYFKNALHDFSFDVAYGDSIRHLHDKGFSAKEIVDYLKAPSINTDIVNKVIEKYVASENPADGNHYEYVTEYDEFGRKSYIRKLIDN